MRSGCVSSNSRAGLPTTTSPRGDDTTLGQVDPLRIILRPRQIHQGDQAVGGAQIDPYDPRLFAEIDLKRRHVFIPFRRRGTFTSVTRYRWIIAVARRRVGLRKNLRPAPRRISRTGQTATVRLLGISLKFLRAASSCGRAESSPPRNSSSAMFSSKTSSSSSGGASLGSSISYFVLQNVVRRGLRDRAAYEKRRSRPPSFRRGLSGSISRSRSGVSGRDASCRLSS